MIHYISPFDILSVEEKTELIIEILQKNIDLNELSFEEQEKLVLEYWKEKKRRNE